MISPRRGDRAFASPNHSRPTRNPPHRFLSKRRFVVLARRCDAEILAPLRGAYHSFPSSGGPRAARGPPATLWQPSGLRERALRARTKPVGRESFALVASAKRLDSSQRRARVPSPLGRGPG